MCQKRRNKSRILKIKKKKKRKKGKERLAVEPFLPGTAHISKFYSH